MDSLFVLAAIAVCGVVFFGTERARGDFSCARHDVGLLWPVGRASAGNVFKSTEPPGLPQIPGPQSATSAGACPTFFALFIVFVMGMQLLSDALLLSRVAGLFLAFDGVCSASGPVAVRLLPCPPSCVRCCCGVAQAELGVHRGVIPYDLLCLVAQKKKDPGVLLKDPGVL